jgi:hypothetical protein
MSTSTKSLYETDFAEWSDQMAKLLREGRFDQVDLENVAEEIESLGRSERKAVRSQLQRLMMHTVKQQIQPDRDGTSWQRSIREARQALLDDIEESPSLRTHLQKNMQKLYKRAVEEALIETSLDYSSLPRECPWTLDFLLETK